LLCFFSIAGDKAFAEKRVALVIGNSAYKNASQLPNPTNNAAALAALFKSAGFDLVDSYQDLGGSEMRRDLRIAFGRVRDDVLKATGNRQEPFVYGSLGGTTVALVPAPRGSGATYADPGNLDFEFVACS
jgi:Caspase domain